MSTLDNPVIDEDEAQDQTRDREARKWADVDEEAEEQRHDVDGLVVVVVEEEEKEEGEEEEEEEGEKEEEIPTGRPRPQSSTREQRSQVRSKSVQPQRKQDQDGQEHGEEDEQPSTFRKSKKAPLGTLLDRIKELSETARMSLEYEKVAREKELEVMKAKDLLDQQVELKKIRLKMEEARQKHERKLAEIEAESRSSIRKEELRTQEHMERLTLIESLTR
ncbi:hypothetical protein BGZ54_005819, partial [Gamsiella multidivaricata]